MSFLKRCFSQAATDRVCTVDIPGPSNTEQRGGQKKGEQLRLIKSCWSSTLLENISRMSLSTLDVDVLPFWTCFSMALSFNIFAYTYIYIYCITFRSIIDIRCKSLLTKMEVSVKETNVPVSEHWGLCGLPVAVANVGAHGMGLFLLRKLRHDGHHSQTSHLGESSKLNFNCEWATLLGPSISGN